MDKHGQLVRSQLFKLRTRPQDVGFMGAPLSGPEVNNPSEYSLVVAAVWCRVPRAASFCAALLPTSICCG